MFKYLEQQRLNYLLLGIAQTANDIGLDRLLPEESAVLQTLYEERAPTKHFFEFAERFHAQLKNRYGTKRESAQSVNRQSLRMTAHSAEPTARLNRTTVSEKHIATQRNNAQGCVAINKKVPVAGGGGLHSRKLSPELELELKSKMDAHSRKSHKTFFLTGNIKTLHMNRPSSSKWNSFVGSKQQLPGYITLSNKPTASTFYGNFSQWGRSPVTSYNSFQRSSHNSPSGSFHQAIPSKNSRRNLQKHTNRTKLAAQSKRLKRKAENESKENLPNPNERIQSPAKVEPKPEIVAIVEQSLKKMKWRQCSPEAYRHNRQKMLDVQFWVRPASNKFDYQSKVREDLPSLFYHKQRQSAQTMVFNKTNILPTGQSESTISHEQPRSDSLLQISI